MPFFFYIEDAIDDTTMSYEFWDFSLETFEIACNIPFL